MLGWKGGNTKNKAGEEEKLLIHTRSRREGGELCVHFTKGGCGEDDITVAKGGRGLADCLISQVRGSVVSGTRTLGP